MAQFGRSLLSNFWAQLIIGALLVILVAPQLITIIRQNAFSSSGSDLLMSSATLLLGCFLIGRALRMRIQSTKTEPAPDHSQQDHTES
jgi:hypothetical protein